MKKYTHNGIELTPQNGGILHPVTGILYPLSWDEMGDIVIEDLPEPEPVALEPQPEYIPTLNPRQIRFVLNQAGLREQVETLIAGADQTTKDYWEFSLEYEFTHPVLVGMANALGITEENRKQMFITGSQL
jgi:hypothetical protein